jgi:signal transduction histidine kinase
MLTPLRVRGQGIGVLSLWSTHRDRAFTQDDLALAEELARRGAAAIENAQLYRESIRAIQQREEFLRVAAHELKTPMTTVKGYVQLLNRQIHSPTMPRERVDRTMERLENQVERFEALVSELLDVSRIQSGRLDLRFEPCDLAEIAGEVVNRFEHSLERTSHHRLLLDASEPVVGQWDASRLDQVVTNLVSNALKYSPEGGDIRVRVRQLGGQAAELTVADQGIGIPLAEQAMLFQPFARGAAATGTAAGSGLGLHITAQIVERHDGTISVQSEPGRGTTFRVVLPLLPSAAVQRPPVVISGAAEPGNDPT